MSYTAEEIRDMALERSDLNNSDLISPAEVLQYISQAERKAFVRGARFNPDYFGVEGNTAARTAHTASWNLAASPGNVVAVTRVEVQAIAGTVTGISVGDEVNLIRVTKPGIELSPRAYLRGKKIYSYGTELGAATANMVTTLKLYYSPIPSKISALTQTVTLYDEWSDLLVLPLAEKFAIHDTRLEEAQLIRQEYQDAWADFVEGVKVLDHGVHRSNFNISAVPLYPVQQQQ